MLPLATALALVLVQLPSFFSLASAQGAPRFLGDRGKGKTFAVPPILRPNVRLWTRVYGEYDSWTEIYYDTKHLDILHSTLDLRPFMGNQATKIKAVEAERHRVQAALRKLQSGKRTGLSPLEQRLLKAYGGRLALLRGAEKRVGAHAGLRDRFGQGLQRLARYKPYVEEVLRRHELPTALTALAMTESLFNPKAKSKAGAYGCWQFLNGTGKEYLHINSIVDERRDPIIATDGAARMLRGNINRLKQWPLALTGYNYGPNGMSRAAAETGSHDLSVILQKWTAPRFKFASRNYYAGFLAALHVMRNQSKYFPTLHIPPPIRFETVTLPASAPLRAVAAHCKASPKAIAELNPHLSEAAVAARVRLPQGFPLRVPAAAASACKRQFHKVAGAVRRAPVKPRSHRVRVGESLIGIAGRYGSTLSAVLKLNGLQKPRNLKVGEKLQVPGGSKTAGFTVVPVTPVKGAKGARSASKSAASAGDRAVQ